MDTTPTGSAPELNSTELAELFDELIERSGDFDQLPSAQREVWVSGLLASWRSDVVVADPDAADAAFRNRCVESTSVVAGELGVVVADVLAAVTASHPVQAWLVGRDETDPTRSVIISFADGSDGEHCLLAEIEMLADPDEACLVDLNFAGPHEDVVPDPMVVRADMGDTITVEEVSIGDAAREVIAAWRIATKHPAAAAGSGLVMNQLAARSRLRACIEGSEDIPGDLPLFTVAPIATPSFTDGMSAEEVTEANAWAVGVLSSALRKLTPPPEPSPALIDAARGPIRGPIDHLDRAEQQALCFLEWADWLGIVIGLMRAGSGASVTPEVLVDLINRSDEVSSTVPDEDRAYMEFALEVAVAMWADGGVVEDGRLTDGGYAALVPAAREAWN